MHELVALVLLAVQTAGQTAASEQPSCAEQVAADGCVLFPLKMFAHCPTSCSEHLNRSALLERVLIDEGVLSTSDCRALIQLHDDVLAVGCVTAACKERRAGNTAPVAVPPQRATGVSLVDIFEWAAHTGTPQAASTALAAFGTSRQLLLQIEQQLRLQGSPAVLSHEFSHLVCRELPETEAALPTSRSNLSMPTHTDNCFPAGRYGCNSENHPTKGRTHTAVCFLNQPPMGGGDFFYSDQLGSLDLATVQTVRVSPKCGRAVGLSAGAGVTAVLGGRRCAFLSWYTTPEALDPTLHEWYERAEQELEKRAAEGAAAGTGADNCLEPAASGTSPEAVAGVPEAVREEESVVKQVLKANSSMIIWSVITLLALFIIVAGSGLAYLIWSRRI